jgi:hypothetical protein
MANDGTEYPRAGGTAMFRQSFKLGVAFRDEMQCQNCLTGLHHAEPSMITLDHLVTVREYNLVWTQAQRDAFGSVNRSENVVLMCRPCNQARGAKAWTEHYSEETQARIRKQVALAPERKLALAFLKNRVG